MLIPIPSGPEGPSGCLVCSESTLTWIKPGSDSVLIQIPSRPKSKFKVLVVSHAVYRLRKTFFVLLQTELGDLFKVTIDSDDGVVLKIRYFDTIPVSGSLVLLKSGFLFASSEFGNQ